MAVSDRVQLHRLVIGAHNATTAPYRRARCRWRLWRGIDPMIAVLDAVPWDGEPLSAEERRQVEASERAMSRDRRRRAW